MMIFVLIILNSLTTNAHSSLLPEGSGLELNLLEADEVSYVEGSSEPVSLSNNPADELLTTSEDVCEGFLLSESTRNLILRTHNSLRSLLAHGKQKNKEGYMGTGKNMYKLSWDCDLERRAQKHIEHCNSTYMAAEDVLSDSHVFKQFWLHWDGYDHEKNIQKAMRTWWELGREKGNEDEKNRYFQSKNYYAWANMAKGKSTRIGCAYQVCKENEKAVFSCLYNQKAQCEQQMIYEKGTPCRKDDDCATYQHSRCIPDEGLCLAPNRVKYDGKCEMCPENENMTDATRRDALDQHNFYRSRIARGLEFNGQTNNTQAMARRMLKLEYDCELEQFAQAWADNCVFAHSQLTERPNQGQNLYMTSFLYSDPRTLMHTAIEKWWQELEEFGMPENNILTADVWAEKGKAIGHWTQMAWDRTYKVGCAVTSCPKMGFVVCHYGPAGNHKGQLVYEIGAPCKSNSTCPRGTMCLLREGLCQIIR